jgi:uncharacterized membrane protein
MRLKSFPIILVISLALVSAVLLTVIRCSGQLQWSTSTQIEVSADGSATWVVQQKTVLLTQDDEAAFYQYLNITSVDQISSHFRSIVDQASLLTGRSMRIENMEVNANVSTAGLSTEGIIQYQFDWIGFAGQTGDGGIKIGDALSGAMDLSREDELTIVYPSGYSVMSIYPLPDNTEASERALTWFGPRNFGAGEPHILLGKENSSWTNAITSNIPLLAAIATAFSAVFLGYFLGMKHAGTNRLTKPNKSSLKSHSSFGAEDDEQKVVRLLTTAGGRMYQSVIGEQGGFSKSKTSELMSAMESKGIVSRKKIGRGKLVTLVGKQETKKEE